MKRLLNSSIIVLLLFACNRPITKFEIDPGTFERSNTPIRLITEKKLNPEKDYYLRNTTNGNTFPVQVLSENSMVCLIDDLSFKNTFYLMQGKINKDQTHAVTLAENAEGVQIFVGSKPVLFYQARTAFPPDTLPQYYKRSGFIHPLQSPNGEILTDDFPVGHVHQHAIFNAWTNTTFKGEKVDFWNQQHQLGTIAHVEIVSKAAGSVVGQFESKLNHISLADGTILEEKWQITVYPVSDYFLFDLFSEQTNISSDTLFINEYLYGGMAFRGSKEWNKDDSLHFTNQWKILTSKGLTLTDANHTKAEWVDASGTVNGKESGLTVFGFPDNFRYPQPIRVHPFMPYWVYSPMVEGDFYIAPGQKYQCKFRYYVHDGLPDINMLDKIQHDLKNPVKIREF